MYVIKNILKSFMMFYLCIDTYSHIYKIFIHNYFEMDKIRWWGIIYVDVIGIIMVDKLPQNTRISSYDDINLIKYSIFIRW